MQSSHDFLGWPFFLFPFLSNSITYLGIDVSMHDMTISLQTALNYHIFNLHNNTHPITKNISRYPINQSYPTHHLDHTTLHPTQAHLIRITGLDKFDIYVVYWFSCTKLRVHKTVTVGANLRRLIYNLLIVIDFSLHILLPVDSKKMTVEDMINTKL